jgi:hypothetical protein
MDISQELEKIIKQAEEDVRTEATSMPFEYYAQDMLLKKAKEYEKQGHQDMAFQVYKTIAEVRYPQEKLEERLSEKYIDGILAESEFFLEMVKKAGMRGKDTQEYFNRIIAPETYLEKGLLEKEYKEHSKKEDPDGTIAIYSIFMVANHYLSWTKEADIASEHKDKFKERANMLFYLGFEHAREKLKSTNLKEYVRKDLLQECLRFSVLINAYEWNTYFASMNGAKTQNNGVKKPSETKSGIEIILVNGIKTRDEMDIIKKFLDKYPLPHHTDMDFEPNLARVYIEAAWQLGKIMQDPKILRMGFEKARMYFPKEKIVFRNFAEAISTAEKPSLWEWIKHQGLNHLIS